MTNEQIIMEQSFNLMEQGVLKGSGEFATLTINGEEKQVELPEAIHTFAGWKALGYAVKKGEKSSIKFPIWKHSRKMLKTDTGNAETDKMNELVNAQGGKTSMYMVTAAFFTAAQVEPIAAKG